MGAGLRSRQIDARPSRGSRVARGARGRGGEELGREQEKLEEGDAPGGEPWVGEEPRGARRRARGDSAAAAGEEARRRCRWLSERELSESARLSRTRAVGISMVGNRP